MPAKLWQRDADGAVKAHLVSHGRPSGSPEDLLLAESLDRDIDQALDAAQRTLSQLTNRDVPQRFTAAWAIGRALQETGLLAHPALDGEQPKFLWQIMAAKAVLSRRNDQSGEGSWDTLRPALDPGRPTARQGSKKGHDYWAMTVWLAEQDYGDAVITFGGSIRNVWQMLDRPTLTPLVLRRAWREWLETLPSAGTKYLTSSKTFPEVMKLLVKRWPARGRRTAMQPIHYQVEELRDEIARLVNSSRIMESAPATNRHSEGTTQVRQKRAAE